MERKKKCNLYLKTPRYMIRTYRFKQSVFNKAKKTNKQTTKNRLEKDLVLSLNTQLAWLKFPFSAQKKKSLQAGVLLFCIRHWAVLRQMAWYTVWTKVLGRVGCTHGKAKEENVSVACAALKLFSGRLWSVSGRSKVADVGYRVVVRIYSKVLLEPKRIFPNCCSWQDFYPYSVRNLIDS